MGRYVQVLTPNESIYDGTHALDSTVTTAEPGFLVKLESDGELTLCGAANNPFGILVKGTSYDVLKPSYDYSASTDILRATYQTVVRGHGIMQLDSESFVGGTLPSAGDAIYTAASGLMNTTGSVQIGVCSAVDTAQTAWSGTISVARIEFEIRPF